MSSWYRDVDGVLREEHERLSWFSTCMNCGEAKIEVIENGGWCDSCSAGPQPERSYECSDEKLAQLLNDLFPPYREPVWLDNKQSDLAAWMGEHVIANLNNPAEPPVALYSAARRAAHHGRKALNEGGD